MSYIPADLRRHILELSGACCEYCRIHQNDNIVKYHIEHIIALTHGGQTDEANLAFSCAHCNLHKGTNIAAADPQTGNPTFLFHPRRHLWDEHFNFDSTGLITGLSPEGRATVLVLKFNDENRSTYRQSLYQLGIYPCHSE